MKVYIIGPVVTAEHTGGVATFVEGLADGFTGTGHETAILTNKADKNITQAGTEIINFKSRTKLGFILSTKRYLKTKEQDLIVGSTWYDLALCLSKKIKGKKIHYLHGFGVPCDGIIKAVGIAVNDKLHKKNCLLVSNSNFTKMINEIFYSTKVDATIPIGISPTFKKIGQNNRKNSDKEYDVLFVGRVRYNKGVERIIDAIQYIKQKYNVILSCVIVGDGPQFNECINKSKKYGLDICFVGKVNQEKTIDYYGKSKVFVSLDIKEPYGQTFIEALICGCNIVCPFSGGQVEYLSAYKERVLMVDSYSSSAVGEAIYQLSNIYDMPAKAEEIYKNHSYEHVAENIIRLIENKNY